MRFKQFLSLTETTEEVGDKTEIIKNFLLRDLGIGERKFKINEDFTVELFCDLEISGQLDAGRVKRLPLKFSKIHGDVWLSQCRLTTLIGLPDELDGDLILINTNIKDLSHCPKIVGEGHGIEIANCPYLVSLKGCPEEIPKNFTINVCHNLKSLEFGPKKVGKNYKIDDSGITNIDFIAEEVGKNILLTNNRYLATLSGIHQKVKSMNGVIDVSGSSIKEAIMGLMILSSKKGCKGYKRLFSGNSKASKAFGIIEKALNDGKDLIDAQDELIDNDLGNFAKL